MGPSVELYHAAASGDMRGIKTALGKGASPFFLDHVRAFLVNITLYVVVSVEIIDRTLDLVLRYIWCHSGVHDKAFVQARSHM